MPQTSATTCIDSVDPDVAALIRAEEERQAAHLELIASENFTDPAVLEAQGSVLTNKYAEGYPGARYYGGCEIVDKVENLARERAKKLFGAEHVNVQPHAGSQANAAAFYALMKPGDTFLAMSLAHGGHITHGLKNSFSGRFFDPVSYGVDPKTERIDYDEVERLAKLNRPALLVAGATAYTRQIDFKRMAHIARGVSASFMVDMAHIAGLVAAGVHESPVPHADVVTFTTHKTLRGPRSGMILCRESVAKKIDSAVFPSLQGGPLMHVIAAKAVSLKIASSDEFKQYQRDVCDNARALADELSSAEFRLVSGGTDNHQVLIDLRDGKRDELTGSDAEDRLGRVGITVNKNLVPFDSRSAKDTSGVRLGTAALTTRGLGTDDFRSVGRWIAQALAPLSTEDDLSRLSEEVERFSRSFPLPH